MIITKLRLQEQHPMSGVSASWPLPYVDLNLDVSAGENGYILKQALGLGPTPLTSVVEGFDSTGIPILGTVASKRILDLKVGLNPGLNQSFGNLRDDLYKFIYRNVLVSFMNGSEIIAQTTGFFQRVEPVHFSNKPELEIFIECVDGILYAPESIDIPLASLAGLIPVIDYPEGSSPTGLDLVFTVNTNHTGFIISGHSKFWYAGNGDVDNVFEVDFPFLDNDVVTISTQVRSKRITVLRGVDLLDLAGFINSGAVWPKLYSGVNTFEWTFAPSWMGWDSASYVPRFWGV